MSPTDAAKYAYTNRIIGATSGLFSAGGLIGALVMGWMCDARGRKAALAISTIVALVGGALQAGSAHIAMFLVARFLTGFGVGMLVTLVPIFQAEIAPPASRGFLVAQHGVILVVGYSIAGWVGFASYYAANPQFQWRFPLALQALWPMLMLSVLPWVPESPRWLLLQRRRDEAWKIVARLHLGADDPDQVFAREEFYQMSRQVETDRVLYENETLMDLFRKPSYRKRMICGFLTMFAAESSGILVIYNYSVILYEGLGYKGSTPLLLSAAYVSCAAVGNYICSLLIDRVGRVRLLGTSLHLKKTIPRIDDALVIGLIGCLCCLCFEAALDAQYTGTTNASGLRAGVFFLFLYISFYGVCIDATTFVYCSEIFPTHIRPKGMAFSIAILFLATIPYLEAAPTAFAEVGWKYYLLFILLTVINIPIIYYYFPETKGLSLEEINEKFGDEVA
ncbi:MAG: hypothetical protein M1830_003560, partial [Pleopsidium flavum]